MVWCHILRFVIVQIVQTTSLISDTEFRSEVVCQVKHFWLVVDDTHVKYGVTVTVLRIV